MEKNHTIIYRVSLNSEQRIERILTANIGRYLSDKHSNHIIDFVYGGFLYEEKELSKN